MTANGCWDSPDLKLQCKMMCGKFAPNRKETPPGFKGGKAKSQR